MYRLFILVIASLLALSSTRGTFAASIDNEATDKPTLRIEEAMRVWQERWALVSGAGQPVGLRNPNFGRIGESPSGIFSKPIAWPTRQDGTSPGAYPGECFYQDDLVRPNFAASYVIALRAAIQTCLGATVAPAPGDTGGVILRFDPNWENHQLQWADPAGPLRAPDASRMFRVFYNDAWVIPDLNTAPWNSVIGGSITIENYELRFQELVNFLKLPFAVNTHGTQVQNLPAIRVPFTHDFFHPDIYRVACDSCSSCASCRAGTSSAGNEKLHFTIGLGTGANGSVGSLFLSAETPSAALSTPAALDVSFAANVVSSSNTTMANDGEARIITSLQDGVNQPRQFYLPGGLVDVVVESSFAYTLRFYDEANRGSLLNGIYTPSGSPHATVRVENPDGAGSTDRLRITTNNGREKIYLYTYTPGIRSWKMETGSGAEKRSETTTETWISGSGNAVGDVLSRVLASADSNGQVVYKVEKRYKIFHWNATSAGVPLVSRGRRYELIEEIVDPDGKALRTQYRYDETVDGSFLTNQSRRRLKQVERWDGSWERYHYDSSGRLSAVYTPLDEAAPTENLSVAPSDGYRQVAYTYQTSPFVEVRTETIRSGGTDYLIGRTWTTKVYSTSYEDITEEQATEPGSSLGDATNLKTISRYHTQGLHAGKLERRVNPDGTVVLTTYVHNRGSGQTTTTVLSGVPQTFSTPFAATGVSEGKRTITITNAQGQEMSRSTYDIASNLLIDDVTAVSFDNHGRVLIQTFLDGTTEQTTYACCGIDTRTDRTGLKTTYTYDAERRVIREVVTQATSSTKYSETEYVYDSRGRLRKTIDHRAFTGIDGTVPVSIVREELVYDGVGNLSKRITPLGETSISESLVGGKRQVTTTYPDASTKIERFDRSGRLVEVSGTAVQPTRSEFGVDTEGSYTKEIRLGEGADLEAEWVRSYVDFAGRPSFTVAADGARVTRSYYSAAEGVAARRGKLKSIVQPGNSLTPGASGERTIYDYNAEGEVEIVAVDLDSDGVIDYSGSDRITKTTTDYVQKAVGGNTYTVSRSTTTVWGTEASDVESVVSISEQSVDGLRSWTTTLGTVSGSAVRTNTGNGVTTNTVTEADGVVVVSNQIGDRLQYMTRTSGATQLKRIDYAYDGFGRLERVTDAAHGTTTATTNGSTINTYFDSGLIKSVTTPDPDAARSGTGYDFQRTFYFYDAMGRVVTVTHPDNTQTYYRYTPQGALWRTWGSRTYPQEYSYDRQGRLRTLATWREFVDEASFGIVASRAVTTWAYSAERGWLTSKTYPDSSAVTYAYYPSGKIRTRNWARGTVTTYAYSEAGELTSVTYSDATPALTGLAYDRLGRRTAWTDAAGATTVGYQGLSSLQTTQATSTGVLAGVTQTWGYDALYRPTSLSVPAASYSHGITYKDGSFVDVVTATLQGTTTTHTYGYLAKSELPTSLVQKVGSTTVLSTARVYDRMNRLASITSTPSVSAVVGTTYGFNGVNQRVLATEASGENWNYSYDALGQVTGATKKTSGASAIAGHQFGYQFDTIGNRTGTARGDQASSYVLRTNNLNQYASRQVPGKQEIVGSADAAANVLVNERPATRQGTVFSADLEVDNTGAPVWKPVSIVASLGSGEVVKEAGDLFIPKTPEEYTYDADGNMTGDGRWTYTWDAENRLTSMETKTAAWQAGAPRQRLEFGYDGQARRVFKKVYAWGGGSFALARSTTYVYDKWNMIAELDALDANAPTRNYAWGLDLSGGFGGAGGVGGLLAIAANSATYAPTYDGNGNVTGLVDFADGKQKATYAYGPFGEVTMRHGSAALDSPFQFSTTFTDGECGLVYYGFRYYNPVIGRWLNRDPIGETDGRNLYSFVLNDGINEYDVLGLFRGPGPAVRPVHRPPMRPGAPNPGPGVPAPYISSPPSEPGYATDTPEGLAAVFAQGEGKPRFEAPAGLSNPSTGTEQQASDLRQKLNRVRGKTKLEPSEACAICPQNSGAGWITYLDPWSSFPGGPQAKGVAGVITGLTPQGTSANINPKGWAAIEDVVGANRARGHLLSRQNGGNGSTIRNIVPLQHSPFNNSTMRREEIAMYQARQRATVCFFIMPKYRGQRGDQGIPFEVSILWISSDGQVGSSNLSHGPGN